MCSWSWSSISKEIARITHNDYTLAPYKTEIRREMLSKYQLKIANLCNIPTGNFRKLLPNFFDKEKYVWLWKLATLLETRIKKKKIYHILEFSQSQWLKPYIEKHAKNNRSRKK